MNNIKNELAHDLKGLEDNHLTNANVETNTNIENQKSDKTDKNTNYNKPTLLIASDTSLPNINGISIFLSRVIEPLSKHYRIILVVPDIGNTHSLESKGIIIKKVPTYNIKIMNIKMPRFLASYKIIKQLFDNENIDLCWTNLIGPICFFCSTIARKHNVPIISQVHSYEARLLSINLTKGVLTSIVEKLLKVYVRCFYNKADLLLIPSDEMKDYFKAIGVATPCETITLGIDTHEFVPLNKSKRSMIRKTLGLGIDDIVLIYVGRLSKEKDIPTLLKAFEKLHTIHKNIKLMVVGPGSKKLIKKLKETDGVVYIGEKIGESLARYYQAADIYVLCSLTETTSQTTLEAMSSGLPVIVTPVGRIKKYVIDKYNGFIFPPQNYLVLAKKLEILIKDREKRELFGKRSRKIVENSFDIKDTINTLVSIFDRFIKIKPNKEL